MAQEKIRQLLCSLEGKATRTEISDAARKKYSNRTLYQYVTQVLKSMEKRGIVEHVNTDNGKVWELTDKGRENKINKIKLSSLENIFSSRELDKMGYNVTNIVGTFEIGREFDLSTLSSDLQNSEYNEKNSSRLIFRSQEDSGVSFFVYRTGRVTIMGGKSKSQIKLAYDYFNSSLKKIGVENINKDNKVMIQNIVSNYELNSKINLSEVIVSLGLNDTEYEPEQFPGVIYTTGIGTTVILFSSGKCTVTGARNYTQVVESVSEIKEKIKN